MAVVKYVIYDTKRKITRRLRLTWSNVLCWGYDALGGWVSDILSVVICDVVDRPHHRPVSWCQQPVSRFEIAVMLARSDRARSFVQ
ncbi:hypothetical protein KGM_204285 [Danaus plexippus plexippus]|uniref:Uncharacterized protein n=1 Tax=Danaus plexippus plexippus TaxID=278856 RepID=A0A212EL46_DANPL|nr:hypothetical protein KGM_204285 [Danaus plexippus plexippus]